MPSARDLSDAFAAVGDRWDDERLRRFGSVCCQRVWHLIPDGPVRAFTIAACDGTTSPFELEVYHAARTVAIASGDMASAVVLQSLPLTRPSAAYFFAGGLAKALANEAVPGAEWPKEWDWDPIPDDPAWREVWAADNSAQASVVRELFPEVWTPDVSQSGG